MISLEDVTDKQKIKELEIAANLDQINEQIVFDIYKQISFNLNTLINAKNIYQTLDEIDSRALIFQKYLLSENIELKLEYLFILDDLFKKHDLNNVFSRVLSDSLLNIGLDNIPPRYREVAEKRILTEEDFTLGKVKYNDKIFHQSKVIRYYLENEDQKKIQKK